MRLWMCRFDFVFIVMYVALVLFSHMCNLSLSTGLLYLIGAPRASEQANYILEIHVSDGPHQIKTIIEMNIHEANLYTPA